MRNLAGRGGLTAVSAVLLIALAGCTVQRGQAFSDMERRRADAYTRWRQAAAEEALARVQGELSLQDAVKLALHYSPALQQVVLQKEKALGQLWEAYADGLPTVEFNANYTRLDQVSTVDLGGISFPMGSKDNWSGAIQVTQPLFKGALFPAVRGARVFAYMNDEAVRQAVQDVILAVAGAYDNVLLARHLYEVQEAALAFAERNLQDVRARQGAGVAIRYDVLRAEVEVSNVKADMIQARNAMNRHMTALLRAMGASQKSEVTLTDVLSYLPGEPTYEACVQKAFLNRPELYQKEFDVQLQQAGVEVFLSHYWPTLEAWATQLWSKPDPHDQTTIHWGDEWQAGLRLKWTLFDGLRREGQIRQQRAAWKQSIIGLSDMEQKVLQEVRNALLDLRDAKELVESQQLNLQQANEALRLVDTGAREGVNTPLDVLDARSALTRTQGLYYQALHAHTVARLSLQRAMGLLGPPPGAEAVPASAPPIGVLEDVQGEQPGASGAMQGGSQPGETASPR